MPLVAVYRHPGVKNGFNKAKPKNQPGFAKMSFAYKNLKVPQDCSVRIMRSPNQILLIVALSLMPHIPHP